jgi:hypothetical protein
MSDSVFADYHARSYPFTIHVELLVNTLVGGVPKDKNVAKAWLETKIKGASDARIQSMVAELMVDQNLTADKALEEINKLKNLTGFEKDPEQGLFIGGRHVKAMLKEAVSVAVAAKKVDMTKWGATRKFLTNYFPEHVFVVEDRIFLGTMEPSGVLQNFVHARGISAIQYQEYVSKARVAFTLVTDHNFTDAQWALIMTTGEKNGLGAGRSQGHGTFDVVKWEKVVDKATAKKLAKEEEDSDELVVTAPDEFKVGKK